jgi:trans-aconitate methyltransferase
MLKGSTSVLDVGAGEGVLRDYLPGVDYTGVEPEADAVARARAKRPGIQIVHSGVEDFTPPRRYTAVVFNESLYYLPDAVGAVMRARDWLVPQGLIVCSVYQRSSQFSLKCFIGSLFDRRRHRSNVHCEQMVRKAMRQWTTVSDDLVQIGDHSYHAWAARIPEGGDMSRARAASG